MCSSYCLLLLLKIHQLLQNVYGHRPVCSYLFVSPDNDSCAIGFMFSQIFLKLATNFRPKDWRNASDSK